MSLNFNDFANNNNNLYVYNKSVEKKIKSSLNCVRVGIVDEFYPDEHVVKVRIANKMLVGLNKDGSHIDDDYAPIFAKVYYMGWKETQVTYPIEVGTEGIVLFNDRELESWYLNGEINSLSSTRMHDITDSIFIAGLHSIPNIVQVIENCLHLCYKTTDLQLQDKNIIAKCDEQAKLTSKTLLVENTDTTINSATSLNITTTTSNITSTTIINGDTTINGNLIVNGDLTVSGDATIGGISFLHHTHGGVLVGGGSTGEPQ